MKVLIVSFYYPPEMGAAPSRISNMAEGLRRQGADVEVLTCLPNYPKGRIFEGYRHRLSAKEVVNGITVYRYWTYATVSRNAVARLAGMLIFAMAIWLFALHGSRVKSYNRIIIQSPPLLVAFSATLLFGCIYRRATILNVSDLWPLSAVELGAVKAGSIYCGVLSWMERFVYRNSRAIQGQSRAILDHIAALGFSKPHFLYLNLQPHSAATDSQPPAGREPLMLVYAGLLGVAQDVLGIIENIDFKAIGAQLHIFGGGNQAASIEEYARSHDSGVFCHGYKSKDEINRVLGAYHASIVPLTVSIKGAVPSKIFDLLPHGTPILYAGGGEGEQIISSYGLGFVSAPGDFDALRSNIMKMKNLSEADYAQLRMNCRETSKGVFSFDQQMSKYSQFLLNLC